MVSCWAADGANAIPNVSSKRRLGTTDDTVGVRGAGGLGGLSSRPRNAMSTGGYGDDERLTRPRYGRSMTAYPIEASELGRERVRRLLRRVRRSMSPQEGQRWLFSPLAALDYHCPAVAAYRSRAGLSVALRNLPPSLERQDGQRVTDPA